MSISSMVELVSPIQRLGVLRARVCPEGLHPIRFRVWAVEYKLAERGLGFTFRVL